MGSVPEKRMRSLGGVADVELRYEPVFGVSIGGFIGFIPNLPIYDLILASSASGNVARGTYFFS